MNAPAFTPGPWVIGDGFECDEIRRADKPHDLICEFPYGTDGEDAANANLVAAAPELYEAVRRFMALDPSFNDATDAQLDALIARGESVRMAKAVKAAKAALAKAVQA